MTAVLPSLAIGYSVERVFTEHARRAGRHVVLLHEVHPGGQMTTCYVSTRDPRDERDHITSPGLVSGRVQWCGYCWLGHRRCVICSAPSGDHCECGACIRASIAVDKWIERAS